ncbi:hypothetical protein R5W24_000393 [Gemmata sp. JC717]|uniref:hypothetical protein n=1 Tax=Gemmata algarum TaxID=2975278 RepID=UPI0021BA8452|nr:hypothetical protein [Gemmata algarum]MDY3551318.1 hypothetical protein [Gemmata algarum]
MNAAFLLMSTAALAGADVAPPPAAPAPAVISSGAGCSNCGTPVAPCNDCGKTKVGLLDKLKARLGGVGKKSHDCGCAPAPVPAPCNDCVTTTVAARPNLFDKLKSRMGHKKASACCGPVCDPCAVAPLSVVPPTPTPGTTTPPSTTPPKEMPKPQEAPKTQPKPKTTKDEAAVPLPLPAAPVTGASGLAGAGNPY